MPTQGVHMVWPGGGDDSRLSNPFAHYSDNFQFRQCWIDVFARMAKHGRELQINGSPANKNVYKGDNFRRETTDNYKRETFGIPTKWEIRTSYLISDIQHRQFYPPARYYSFSMFSCPKGGKIHQILKFCGGESTILMHAIYVGFIPRVVNCDAGYG